MPSEYDPLPPRSDLSAGPTDLDQARVLFSAAAAGYLRSPWSWWFWAIILAAVALMTERVHAVAGPLSVLVLWSVAILLGGLIEAALILRGRTVGERTPLAGWVLRGQGNLSFVALALSIVFVWTGHARYLPGLWLLVVGHSLFTVGGLSLRSLKTGGLMLQLGGVVALLPAVDGTMAFALSAFAACAWVGWGVRRRLRGERSR